MARSKSSSRWLKEHFDDEYVKRAQQEGLRSRAAFKLKELDDKDHFLGRGMTVVDLGAAPGGWSQVAAERVGDEGRVIALDLLPMDALAGVEVLRGDFTEQDTLDRLMTSLAGRPVDLVLSDMAPNISGMKSVDQPRAMYLTELAFEFAREVLRPGGGLVMKIFQGEGSDALMRSIRGAFRAVAVRKPKASRPRSREVYVVARNYHV